MVLCWAMESTVCEQGSHRHLLKLLTLRSFGSVSAEKFHMRKAILFNLCICTSSTKDTFLSFTLLREQFRCAGEPKWELNHLCCFNAYLQFLMSNIILVSDLSKDTLVPVPWGLVSVCILLLCSQTSWLYSVMNLFLHVIIRA